MQNEKQNTLILHHFESHWNHGLSKFDLTIEQMSDQIIDFLTHKNPEINNIIITRFEGIDFEPEHEKLIKFSEDKGINIRVEEYAYSYYEESFRPNEYEFVKPTRDNSDEDNVLPVMEWQKDLKKHNSVFLAGAFEGECVRDVEDILEHVGAKFKKMDELVVGTYVDYEYVMSPDKIVSKLQKGIEDAERKFERAVDRNKEDEELVKIEKDLNKLFLSSKLENGVKYYSQIQENLYSNVDEVNDIISNILMSGEPSTQYKPSDAESKKNDILNSFKNAPETKKHTNKLKI